MNLLIESSKTLKHNGLHNTRQGPILLLGLFLGLLSFGAETDAVPLNIESPNVDFTNNTLSEPVRTLHRLGCRYKALVFAPGESVPTDEPCLFCHCKGSVVVCKLRICPEVPDTPPPGCVIVQKANKCCSQLQCFDNPARKLSREQRLPGENETLPSAAIAGMEKGNYCVHDGTVYAEGSAMRSSTLCQHCFCIRGEMKCSSPQCVIPMKGCKPQFRSYACCPTNYDCNQSNQTAILQTIPSSTPIPQFLKGCKVGGRFVAEGEPVLPIQLASGLGNTTSVCQTCFCMGGVVHCRPLECDRAIEGCRPIVEDGHCCPDRYECEELANTTAKTTQVANLADSSSTSTIRPSINATTEVPQTTKNLLQLVPKAVAIRARKDDEAEKTTIMSDVDKEGSTLSPETISNTTFNLPKNSLLKKARISTTSVGGFKNRSDAGSREQRRNKDRLEFLSRSFYEDDAREDESSGGMDNSDQSDEKPSVFFEEPAEASNFNADTEGPTISDSGLPTPTVIVPVKDDVVTENDREILSENEVETTTFMPLKGMLEDEPESTTLSINSQPSFYVTPELAEVKNDTEFSNHPSEETSTTLHESASTESSVSTRTIVPSFETTLSSQYSSGTGNGETTVTNLEFIPFGVEDAVMNPSNETRYEVYPAQVTSLPSYDTVARQGSLIPPTPQKGYLALKPLKLQTPEATNSSISDEPVPIIVEKEEVRNAIYDAPAQASLYNNGYYKHGLLVDDIGKDEDLIITQAEMGDSSSTRPSAGFHGHVFEETSDSGVIGIGEAIPDTIPPSLKEETTLRPTISPMTIVEDRKKPEEPLKAISSIQNFIPSFPPVASSPSSNDTDHPSRTYSKFGIQDSSYYRYGYPGSPGGFLPSNPSSIDRHRYYNPSDSFITNIDQTRRKVPQHKEPHDSRVRYNPYQPYEDPLVYEDASDEIRSYEHFFGPPTTPSPLRNRYGIPSNGHQSPQHTPPISFNPVPLISSSGSTVSLSSTKTTKKPSMKIINSKPLRRPKPVVEDQHLDASDPLSFKPVVAFPFAIPKSQNNYNMGLKLSGCNIYGKMYGLGQVIHELSSICVTCTCTEVGVQCAEMQC